MPKRRSYLSPGCKRQLASFPEVVNYLRVCRGTLYRWIEAGCFTPPFSLGGRKRYWYLDEVIELVHARAANSSEGSIKDLIRKQLASREVVTNAN
jgi:predicted DNA-binding transcriptional regulator AlpA